MPTMNVSLTEELVRFVESEVASGEYATASEVVRDGLRLLLRDQAVRAEKLEILQRELMIGYDDWKAGRMSEFSARAISDAMDAAADDAA